MNANPTPRRSALRTATKVVISLVLLFAGALGGYALFVPRLRTAPIVPALARQAQRTLSTLPTATLTNDQGRDEATTFLTSVLEAADPDPRRESQLRSAAQTIVEFFAARASGDPADYRRWAESRGCFLRKDWPDWPPGRGQHEFEAIARETLGSHTPDAVTPESFFDAQHRASLSAQHGAFAPHSLCVGPLAAEAVATTFTHPSDTFEYAERIEWRGLGADVWIGGATAPCFRFFDPSRSLEDLLQDHPAVPALRVLVVCETRTGLRIPYDLWLIQDPASDQWHIYRLWENNVGAATGVGPQNVMTPLY